MTNTNNSMQYENLKEVVNFLQSIDRNGTYIDILDELANEETTIEVELEYLNDTLNRFLEDMQGILNPTNSDIKHMYEFKYYIELCNM